jgi:hypothetical protein
MRLCAGIIVLVSCAFGQRSLFEAADVRPNKLNPASLNAGMTGPLVHAGTYWIRSATMLRYRG